MTIKAIVFDVDGTLTDGGIYIGPSGEVMKRFDVKDGYAIHTLMPQNNILPIIITGRKSEIVEMRCKELGIKHIYQGVSNKVQQLKDVINLLKIGLDEVAYFGDDINDLASMRLTGYSGCPADAVNEVKNNADYICQNTGGHSAAREFIEKVIRDKTSR